MQRGICKLCLNDADLCKSHYVSKALYNLARHKGTNPIMVFLLALGVAETNVDETLCNLNEAFALPPMRGEMSVKFGEEYASFEVVNRDGRFRAFGDGTACACEAGGQVLHLFRYRRWP